MPSLTLRDLPPELLAQAKARALAGKTTLQAVMRTFLERYAAHGLPGSAGARARALSLTPERRREIAAMGTPAREKNRQG